MSTFKVTWDQWFRCGRDGDDSDFEEYVLFFETFERAEQFVSELVAGDCLGVFDRTVHRNEVTITECEV